MKNILNPIFLVLTFNLAQAQFIKEEAIGVQIGYGLSSPYDTAEDIADDGFFMQGEYIMKIASWAELKPYAGFISTSSNGEDINGNPTNEKAETKAVLIGGKARVRAPIPWVAPYIEAGLGGSIGKFETFTAFTDINKSGLVYHVPLSFGLELGPKHNIDLGLSYYFHPTVKQYAGAFAVGLEIHLGSK